MAKEVSTTSESLPAFLIKGSARGTENVTQSDLIIPRLELVQSLSPCRKKSDPSYIEGADEGMLYNNVTRELYGPEARVVPVSYRKEFLIWKDRSKGGGFRGTFPSMEAALAAKRELEDGSDCEILDTAQYFCLLLGQDKVEEIVISMSRSKLKTSRKWNSLIRMHEVDSFARAYRLMAVSQTNSMNQDYWGFDVQNDTYVTEDVYKRAEALWSQINEGSVRVNSDHDESEY